MHEDNDEPSAKGIGVPGSEMLEAKSTHTGSSSSPVPLLKDSLVWGFLTWCVGKTASPRQKNGIASRSGSLRPALSGRLAQDAVVMEWEAMGSMIIALSSTAKKILLQGKSKEKEAVVDLCCFFLCLLQRGFRVLR